MTEYILSPNPDVSFQQPDLTLNVGQTGEFLSMQAKYAHVKARLEDCYHIHSEKRGVGEMIYLMNGVTENSKNKRVDLSRMENSQRVVHPLLRYDFNVGEKEFGVAGVTLATLAEVLSIYTLNPLFIYGEEEHERRYSAPIKGDLVLMYLKDRKQFSMSQFESKSVAINDKIPTVAVLAYYGASTMLDYSRVDEKGKIKTKLSAGTDLNVIGIETVAAMHSNNPKTLLAMSIRDPLHFLATAIKVTKPIDK